MLTRRASVKLNIVTELQNYASIGARGERTISIGRLQKMSYGRFSAITSFANHIRLYQIAPLAHDMPPSRRVSKNAPFARR